MDQALQSTCSALLIGLGSVGLTIILRNGPIIRDWVLEMKKPWACNVCMPLHTCAALMVIRYLVDGEGSWIEFLPAYALSYIVLQKLADPPGPPPAFPDLFGDAEGSMED